MPVLVYDTPEARAPITKARVVQVRLDVANRSAEIICVCSDENDIDVNTMTHTITIDQAVVDSFTEDLMAALVAAQAVPSGTVE